MKEFTKSGWTFLFQPQRVFIALMIAVLAWLFPFASFQPKIVRPIEHGVIISADPFTAGALGPCSAVQCDPGYCCHPDRIPLCSPAGCGSGGDPTPVPVYPPTISGSLNCSSWGNNGWCRGNLVLALSASDPQGASMIISGSVNGTGFACPAGAASCSIDITDEGAGPITFRVDSATGLYSEGSTTYYLDVTTPDIDGSFLGVTGANGWYVSTVDLTASAWDTLSGLASFDMSLNGGSFISYADTTFTDGMHTVELSATDNAGNSTETTITFNIDTTTPSLNVSINGTMGRNGWYRTNVQVSASAGDAGSGVAQVQVSRDGGAYTSYTSPVSFPDGDHTYQFKVTDYAGNVTESTVQEIHVDATGPDIQLVEETELGETLYYEVQDNGSELTLLQFVIEDEDERFDKLIWSEDISGDYHDGGILWDGKFADGTQASTGTYTLTIKAKDAAGNETRKLGVITVDLFSFLLDIPPFVPPSFVLSGAPVETKREEGETNAQSADEGTTTPGIAFGGNTVSRIGNTYTKTTFLAPSTTNPLTATDSQNIVWGAIAAAAVAATLAEWQRKREEEEVARRPETRGQSDYLRKAVSKRIQRDAAIQAQNREKAHLATVNAAMERKMAREDAAEEARWLAMKQTEDAKKVELQAGLAAYYDAMRKGEKYASVGASKVLPAPTIYQDPEPKDFWEKLKDWWNSLWNLSAQPSTPLPTAQAFITRAATKTPTPTATFTPFPTSTLTVTPSPRPTSSYVNEQLRKYGIHLSGDITDAQIATFLQATELSSNKFIPFTGGTPQQAFIMSHGTLMIIVDKDATIENGNCETERVLRGTKYWPAQNRYPDIDIAQTITCEEVPSLTNLLHEFGHAFDNQYQIHGSPNHEHLLSDHLGDLVVDGRYLRQLSPGQVARSSFGFKGNEDPSLENFWTPTLSEELADTYLNAVLDRTGINLDTNGFSNNNYGDARRSEWNDLIDRWKNDMRKWFSEFSK